MPPRSEPPRYVPPAKPVAHQDGERLQKILSAAGLGSRRDCEELILAGRVEVDRQTVTTLGTKANVHDQEIRVDGEPLPRPKLTYYAVYKPVGVVSTNADPAGRPRVVDLVPDKGGHLFAVGRLDMSSEGLILVTNDGELANRLTHPRYGVEKTYHVEVAGRLEKEQLAELRKGVYLAEGFAKVVNVTIKKTMGKSTLLEMVLDEGKNREVRRLLARVGHKVLRLKRVAIGPLRLGELPTGAYRPLTYEELEKLQAAAGGRRGKARRKPPRSRRPSGGKKPKAAPGAAARRTGGKPASGARPSSGARPASVLADKPVPRGLGTVIGGEPAPAPVRPRPPKPGKPGGKAAGRPASGRKRPAGKPGKPGGKPAAGKGERGTRGARQR